MADPTNPTPSADPVPQAAAEDMVIESDPILGAYVAHYPSNRLLLLLRAGVFYGVCVVVIQLLFAGVDDSTAAFFLPMLFAAPALAAGWYVLHLWNREVILYERGFTYREGSRLGQFLYTRIHHIRQRVERVAYFGVLRRTVYQATLISDQDEVLTLTNLYSNIGQLLNELETAITLARLPLVEVQLARGERLDFGGLYLTQQGIETEQTALTWQNFAGYEIAGKMLRLRRVSPPEALAVPIAGLENALLLLRLLKKRQRTTLHPPEQAASS